MKQRKLRRPPSGPPNLAAKALGSKIFGLKVITPKKTYTRKVKHRQDARDDSLPPFVWRRQQDETE